MSGRVTFRIFRPSPKSGNVSCQHLSYTFYTRIFAFFFSFHRFLLEFLVVPGLFIRFVMVRYGFAGASLMIYVEMTLMGY